MKKLKLNLHHIESSQVLTREQLKKVLGGAVNTTTQGGYCSASVDCGNGTTASCTGTGNRCYHNVTCANGAAGVRCDEGEMLCCAAD
ncbi:hypothetical protein [Chitinophaga niabensis]|uniref:Uncharacterized protein n=1 Tax=Chitinophaga niabensis TaxID=536979 RepID=A0A1N6DTU6_9BACT|nr:hypothetical protein [Chitinophaga niabensis]SIN74206.1 hypothetical protein SAMN04488055_1075 [Chitinophaga niabensis]